MGSWEWGDVDGWALCESQLKARNEGISYGERGRDISFDPFAPCHEVGE